MTSARSVLEQAVNALNSRQEAAFVALGAPDIDLPSPGGLNFHGTEGFRAWYRLWDDACPDHVVRYHNIVGDGEQAIGEGIFTGTQTGVLHLPTGDVPPSGRKLKADFAAVIRVKDGKITYLRHYFDVMDMMVQLGLVGAPATA
jgi:predicted ester cyclase